MHVSVSMIIYLYFIAIFSMIGFLVLFVCIF